MNRISRQDFIRGGSAGFSTLLRAGLAFAGCVVLLIGGAGLSGAVAVREVSADSLQRADEAAQKKDFDEARNYITSGDWAKAEDAFINFIDTHPRSRNLDAALYWLAFSMKRQNKFQQADQVLERLARDFPRSAWSDDARSMRVEIAAQLGNSEMIGEAARNPAHDEAKIVALQTLARQEPEKATTILLDILKPNSGASKGAKEAAINLLAQSGAAQAAPVLAQMARDETDHDLRKGAIRALGRVGGESELDLLEHLTRQEEGNEVGDAAIFALAQHQSPRAMEFLSQLAGATQSPRTRQRIILWLGTREGSAGLEALTRILNIVPDFDVKREIVISLFRHGDRAGGGEAKTRLLEIARSANDPELRKEAMMWVGRLRDERVIDDLSKLYDEEQNESIREFIIGVLGRAFGQTQSQRERAQKKLKEIADGDASVDLRARAAFWLSQSNNSGASPPVAGFPPSLAPNAKGPGAISLPVPQSVSSAPAAQRQGFIEVSGNSLKGKLDAAIARGRDGTQPARFWLGYSFDVRPGRAYKASVANPEANASTMSFDGPVPPGSPLETRNLAVFLLYEAKTGAIERVELLNLDRQQQYEGHPVYWLGRAEAQESLSLLQGLLEAGQSGPVFDKALAAIALHRPSGSAATKEDEAVSILMGIAQKHPSETMRQHARNWLRQINDGRTRDFLDRLQQ